MPSRAVLRPAFTPLGGVASPLGAAPAARLSSWARGGAGSVGGGRPTTPVVPARVRSRRRAAVVAVVEPPVAPGAPRPPVVTSESAAAGVSGAAAGATLRDLEGRPIAGDPRYPFPATHPVAAELQRDAAAWPSVPHLWASVAAKHGDRVAVLDPHQVAAAASDASAGGNGGGGLDMTRLTYREVAELVGLATGGLRELGVRAGEHVALFAENSASWLVGWNAISATGAASAVRGVAAPLPELAYIYDHSQSMGLVVQDAALLAKLAPVLNAAAVRFVVVLQGAAPPASSLPSGWTAPLHTFDDLIAMGRNSTRSREPTAGRSDVATLLYTSGTTGSPKGAKLTHDNLLSQVSQLSMGAADPLPGQVFVSVLPCWHVFELTASLFCFSKAATTVYSSVRHFREDLATHRPHILVAVPRVFESLHATIAKRLSAASGVRKAIFRFATRVGKWNMVLRRLLYGLSLYAPARPSLPMRLLLAVMIVLLSPLVALTDKLVWSKIRAATGGRVSVVVCGGGILSGYLEDFFEIAGVPIFVGYGSTETSPVVVNRYAQHNVRGSAGLACPGTEVKLVDLETRQPVAPGATGVLLVRGRQVFAGYHRNDKATAAAIDADGFFDTGDLAWQGPSGDMVITGRSKDVVVLSSGENVEPGPIEEAIAEWDAVDQVMLVGQDQRSLAALVVPRLDELVAMGFLDEAGRKEVESLAGTTNGQPALRRLEAALSSRPDVQAAFKKGIAERNMARRSYNGATDRVASVYLLLEPMTVENGMMTQTLKIKKPIVADTYAPQIDSLFARPPAAV